MAGSPLRSTLAWIDPVPRPGWANMAIDSALLDLAALHRRAFFRVYRWEPFCLSFGRHEPALRRYDTARIRELGLDCVRRPTGGRAVWHARELTYAFVAPLAEAPNLRTTYYQIHTVLAQAVRQLGAAAALAPAPRGSLGVDGGPCFAIAAGGEVVVDHAKVIGSAQLRTDTALLQHGSILLDDDQSLVRELMTKRRADEAIPASEAPLNRLLSTPTTYDRLAAAIFDCLRQDRPVEVPSEPPSQVLQHAERYYHQYQSFEWTWSR